MKLDKDSQINTLSTHWVKEFNANCPLNEYPRPQMVRENWQCLNGKWEYAVTDNSDSCPITMDGTIVVPYAIESSLSGVCRKFTQNEKLHYKRQFSVENRIPDCRVLLHCEAVDWKCEINVNGKLVTSHTGGYIPFSIDITDFLNDSSNELYITATDPTDSGWQQRGKQFLDPKTIWYTATSGIWQTVWLECVPTNYIKSLKMTPCNDLESLSVITETSSGNDVHIEIYHEKELISKSNIKANAENIISLPNPHLWSPDDPFLYNIFLRTDSDCVTSYFGMRTISLEIDKCGRNAIYLNKKPVFLNGPLDQGYWPEGGMTQPSDEALIFDIEQMKTLGFNMIRKHVKIESRRWYYHADRLGILVIQDMPNGGKEIVDHIGALSKTIFGNAPKDDTPLSYEFANRNLVESRENFEYELKEMLSHLYNHPSIIIWGPFNEAWGQFDSWRIYKNTKSNDPSRLVDHASGWHDQGCGDFLSVHTYKKKLKNPPKNDKRAYIISEYGGYNYIDNNHLWRNDDEYGYKYFPTIEKLNYAYESLIKDQVIPLIGKGLCGVVYTQLSDVEIETNGLFTYDRKVLKFDSKKLKALHNEVQKKFNDVNSGLI